VPHLNLNRELGEKHTPENEQYNREDIIISGF
jgi:hypothetical protein